MRRTMSGLAVCRGVGLHSGQPATMEIGPAEAGTGILFRRSDLAGRPAIPARFDAVVDTRLCTRLMAAEGGASLGTVEHVMAALAAIGITDAEIAVDGPEVPIMDGSAQPYVAAIAAAGVVELDAPLRAIRILRPVEVASEGRVARLLPADRLEIGFEIAFDDPAIGSQSVDLALTNGAALAELAECRTFGRLAEVEQLRKLGLARGGSLENAIVVDRGRILNPGGLRRADEFVRHKVLDALGDLALAGAPIIGRYEGVRAGHEMTNRLLRALFADPQAWGWDEAAADRIPHADLPLATRTAPREALAV